MAEMGVAFCDGFLGVVASLALFRSSISRWRRSRPQQVQLGTAFDRPASPQIKEAVEVTELGPWQFRQELQRNFRSGWLIYFSAPNGT